MNDELELAAEKFLCAWKELSPQLKQAVEHMRLFNKDFRIYPVYKEIRELEEALRKIKNEKHASGNGTGS